MNLLSSLCNIFMYFSSGHVVSECGISFGNNQFRGELIHLFTSTGIIIANLRFSIILNTKFCGSTHILTAFLGFLRTLTRSPDNDVTSKMEFNQLVVRKHSFLIIL